MFSPRRSRVSLRDRTGRPSTSPPSPSDSGSTPRNRQARSIASNALSPSSIRNRANGSPVATSARTAIPNGRASAAAMSSSCASCHSPGAVAAEQSTRSPVASRPDTSIWWFRSS